MGALCSADQDGGGQPSNNSSSHIPRSHPRSSDPAKAENMQYTNTPRPNLMTDSAALEGWRSVQHLQFQAFATVAATRPITMEDWHRRNVFVGRIALVCKGVSRSQCWRSSQCGLCTYWWQAVAPADTPVNGDRLDDRLDRCIIINETITAADRRPWWTIVQSSRFHVNAVIIALADGCPALTSVNMSGLYNDLTDAAIIALAKGCPALINVDVRNCSTLTDAAIIGLAVRCPALTAIKVSQCNKLTDVAIIALADGCPALINVSSIHSNQTDAAMIALANGCPALTNVNVGCCPIDFARFRISGT